MEYTFNLRYFPNFAENTLKRSYQFRQALAAEVAATKIVYIERYEVVVVLMINDASEWIEHSVIES